MISQLCVYPLKSGRGIDLEQAQIDAKGILGDREMMLVSGSGKFITQRQFPELAKVKVQILEYKVIFQSTDSSTDLTLDLRFLDDALIEVEIWGDRHKAIDLGDEAALELSAS